VSADDIQPTRAPDGLAGLERPGFTSGLVGIGDVIDGYRIERIAGSGGMGVVYQAEETGLGRRVALKIIAPERALDPGSRALFAKEATAAAAVEHPNVLPVYRVGETGSGQPYIAMRFVNGPSLKELLATSGALAPGRAAHISTEIGRALAAAHAEGLLHRDVKPGNIMIASAQGRDHAYLADFGISAATAPPGSTVGTAGYLAPEILAGGPPTPAADVYGLGCVLLECLVGHTPSSPFDAATAISNGAPSTPTALKDALLAALSADPTKRPTGTQFADAVSASRHDLVIIHHPADAALADDVLEALRGERLDVVAVSTDGLDALHASAGCAVLVGARGLGRWARPALMAVDDVSTRDPGFGRLVVSIPGSPALHDQALDPVAGWPGLRLHAVQSNDEVVRAIVRTYRAGAGQAVVGDRDICPYPGLDSFDETTANFFVGREEETAELVGALQSGRFVAVLGASGYGKSSLVFAGLVPALAGGAVGGIDRWRVAKVTPGERPAARIAEALTNLAGIGPLSAEELQRSVGSIDRAVGTGSPETNERVLLVCDQFEEIFTLCDDTAERESVVDALVHASTIPGGRFVLVLAMRADFYPRLADHQRLRSLVSAHQLLVGPLTGDALRRAIEVPAASAGLDLEPGLAQTVAEDVSGRPGALPLMSHVLSEVWQRRQGRELTLASYAACGGVEGALARRAEEVYESVEPDDRSLTRRVLLRLVTPGEGTEDTRNRVPVLDLASGGGRPSDVERILQTLTQARLVTVSSDETGEPAAELTHEALLRGWPRLRSWIDESRDGLRLQRQLAIDAAEWTRARDDGALLRGARLAIWADRPADELNESERTFLTSSRNRADGDARARRRRTQFAVSGLSGGLLAVGGLAAFAFVQRNDAAGARDAARSRVFARGTPVRPGTQPPACETRGPGDGYGRG
jgi:hypothetical protein